MFGRQHLTLLCFSMSFQLLSSKPFPLVGCRQVGTVLLCELHAFSYLRQPSPTFQAELVSLTPCAANSVIHQVISYMADVSDPIALAFLPFGVSTLLDNSDLRSYAHRK